VFKGDERVYDFVRLHLQIGSAKVENKIFFAWNSSKQRNASLCS